MNNTIKKLRIWWSRYKSDKATKRLMLKRKERIFVEKYKDINIFNYWYYIRSVRKWG